MSNTKLRAESQSRRWMNMWHTQMSWSTAGGRVEGNPGDNGGGGVVKEGEAGVGVDSRGECGGAHPRWPSPVEAPRLH